MKKQRLIAAVALSVALSVALTQSADAFSGRGGRSGGGGLRGRPQTSFNPAFMGPTPGFNNPGGYNRSFPGMDTPGFFGFRGFNNRGFNNRGFKGNGGFGAFAPWGTTTVWGGPMDYGFGYDYPAPPNYPMITYAPQYFAPTYPAAYPPQMGGSISLAPAPAPPASVVAFPGGRYELQGDGMGAPYQWVWLPAVPPVPPPPPTAPPAPSAKSQPEPPSADDAPIRRSQLYRWTDDQGAVHWTNRAESVPEKYRSQAKYNPS